MIIQFDTNCPICFLLKRSAGQIIPWPPLLAPFFPTSGRFMLPDSSRIDFVDSKQSNTNDFCYYCQEKPKKAIVTFWSGCP
jgi:hypothetical protein